MTLELILYGFAILIGCYYPTNRKRKICGLPLQSDKHGTCYHTTAMSAHVNDGTSKMVYFEHCPKCGELI